MQGLGRLYDLSIGFAPVDTQTGANTGKRFNMRLCQAVSVVLFKGAGVGTDVPVFTLNEHTASSGGSSQVLAKIAKWHKKSATTLLGSEAWVTTTQAAGSTLTLTGEAAKQGIYVFDIEAVSLSDGFTHISVDVADTGAAGAQLAGLLYLPHDLVVQRAPANLQAGLS